jgi:hypothetical protein
VLLAAGGHGAPLEGLVPGDVPLLPLLFWLPEVGGFELDVPGFGAGPEAPFAVLGIVPQGEPLGDVPGLFVVFGLTVDGWVLLPGAAVFGELEPGTLVFGVPLGEVDPGLVCPGDVCGAAVPVGGFTAPVGGAVGEAVGEVGVELCPALLEPPAGRAPPAELWATAQLAQHNRTDSSVSFGDDIIRPPGVSNLPACFVVKSQAQYGHA